MASVDPLAALARQQKLAAAARRAVDACLPQLTSVDLGLPNAHPCKTNPFAPPTAGQSAAPPRAAQAPIPTPWEARYTSRTCARSPASRPPGTV